MAEEKNPLSENGALDQSTEHFNRIADDIQAQAQATDQAHPTAERIIDGIQKGLEEIRTLHSENTEIRTAIDKIAWELDQINRKLNPIVSQENDINSQENSEKPTFEKPSEQELPNTSTKQQRPVITLLSRSFNVVTGIGLTVLMTARPIAPLIQKLLP